MVTVESRSRLRVLLQAHALASPTAMGRAARGLVRELRALDVAVIESEDSDDAAAIIATDPGLDAVLLDWDVNDDHHARAKELVEACRLRTACPIFLLADLGDLASVPLDVIERVDDFIWLLEDTPDFIAGRVAGAARRYRDELLPPMFAALAAFAGTYEYSWHTPGHAGGTAFLKSPVGRAFFEFFGEPMFRSDLSISVAELGSLLDHSGPIGASERNAAKVFGADRTYSVTNGTSTSNRIVLGATVTAGDVVLCDRNCHKSIEHGLTLTGGIPAYLMPTRNRYGIIGPIPPAHLTRQVIDRSLAANPLTSGAGPAPVLAVITNSTYDGLCYRVTRVAELLGPMVDRILFDEAWYAYARFNPIYRERFAMHDSPASDGPTVFATQSTHKLLAALSQASFIHVRDGRRPVEHERFNESFMMHSSTSPQYAIIASNDVSAAMMAGTGGRQRTDETIREALAFRTTMARLDRQLAEQHQWFFHVWQPDTVLDPTDGTRQRFEDAGAILAADPAAWVLHPGETWHGFDAPGDAALEDGYCMLDPIKVTVLTPGIAQDGSLEPTGIPAPIVTACLDRQRIVVEKTGDFTLLFLFSMGVTKGKWGTLVTALLDFKKQYDANAPLEEVLPTLVEAHPDAYRGKGLRDLATDMFEFGRRAGTTRLLDAAYATLPPPVLSPADAYRRLVRGEVEPIPLAAAAGRLAATGIVPYPPGIPLLMPGERFGQADEPQLAYLLALQAFDRRFPGFGHETHGVEIVGGEYRLLCITEKHPARVRRGGKKA